MRPAWSPIVSLAALSLAATTIVHTPADSAALAAHVFRGRIFASRFLDRRARGLPNDNATLYVVELTVDITQTLRPQDEGLPVRVIVRSQEAAFSPQPNWSVGKEAYFFTVRHLGRGGSATYYIDVTPDRDLFYSIERKAEVEKAVHDVPGPGIRLRARASGRT